MEMHIIRHLSEQWWVTDCITSINFLTWKPHTSFTWRHKFKSISATSNPSRILDRPWNKNPIETKAIYRIYFSNLSNHFIPYRSSGAVGSSHVTGAVEMTECFMGRLAITGGEFIRKDFSSNSIYGTCEITVSYGCVTSFYTP